MHLRGISKNVLEVESDMDCQCPGVDAPCNCPCGGPFPACGSGGSGDDDEGDDDEGDDDEGDDEDEGNGEDDGEDDGGGNGSGGNGGACGNPNVSAPHCQYRCQGYGNPICKSDSVVVS